MLLFIKNNVDYRFGKAVIGDTIEISKSSSSPLPISVRDALISSQSKESVLQTVKTVTKDGKIAIESFLVSNKKIEVPKYDLIEALGLYDLLKKELPDVSTRIEYVTDSEGYLYEQEGVTFFLDKFIIDGMLFSLQNKNNSKDITVSEKFGILYVTLRHSKDGIKITKSILEYLIENKKVIETFEF